jgi:hypothetical protein
MKPILEPEFEQEIIKPKIKMNINTIGMLGLVFMLKRTKRIYFNSYEFELH